MKKKILFICSNMNIGGFQISLINLLKNFDYNSYNVDLFLLDKKGLFIQEIPKEVNLVELDNYEIDFFDSTVDSIKSLYHKRKYFLSLARFFVGIIQMIDKGYGAILMSKFIPNIADEYDCCIDYNGQYLNYYMIDKVKAKKKITYFHSDYAKWDYYKHADKMYYKKADAIVTVSDICVESMKKYFPKYADKIYCIENIISKNTVQPKAYINHISLDKNKIILMTVGRVCFDKGYDLAFEAAKLLKNDFNNFIWYWVGPGNEDKEIQGKLKEYKLENKFKFLGPSADPYYYLEQADIAVYPSRFEGKSVVIEETKIINKPIVVTNFSTVNNQVQNRKSGLIVDMDGVAIYRAIKELIENKELYKSIIDFQKSNSIGNDEEINKLYKLINK